jgi:hypothetical protein
VANTGFIIVNTEFYTLEITEITYGEPGIKPGLNQFNNQALPQNLFIIQSGIKKKRDFLRKNTHTAKK